MDRMAHGLIIRHIGLHKQPFRAQIFQFLKCGGGQIRLVVLALFGRLPNIDHHHLRAFSRQCQGNAPPNAGTRPGNQCHAAVEFHSPPLSIFPTLGLSLRTMAPHYPA